MLETGWQGYTQVASGNVRQNIGSSGATTTVIMYAPTATHVGSLGDGPNGNLLSVSKVNTTDFFLTDQWAYKRATFNLGVRFDHYDGFTPQQQQLAYTFPTGLAIPAQTFPETHYVSWNSFVPRLGLSYDLMGDGKTVLKLNYGLYRFNPGVGLASSANPNQAVKSITYNWTDAGNCAGCIAGDRLFQVGEQGALTSSALAGTTSVDPNLKQPHSTQVTAYLQPQISGGFGPRPRFVLNKPFNQFETFQPF